MKKLVLCLIPILATACADGSFLAGERSVGLVKAVRTGGPVIIYDVLAKPLPEIPLPNDQATPTRSNLCDRSSG